MILEFINDHLYEEIMNDFFMMDSGITKSLNKQK